MTSQILTQNRLKELLDYDPATGAFTWRIRRGRAKAGTIAGAAHPEGHRRISIDGAAYLAHRLAWLYTFNHWPENEIGHIDRDKANNRIGNLRDVTRGQNQQNCAIQRNNRSGHKGVSYVKRRGKWQASIGVNGKHNHLGYFDTPEKAGAAYQNAAAALHSHRPRG